MNMQNEDPGLNIQNEEPMVSQVKEEAETAGPVVDPTGTFTDWSGLRESGYLTEGMGEKEEDVIPLPMTDEEGYKILKPNPNVTIGRPVYGIQPPRKGFMPIFNFCGTELEMYGDMVKYDIHNQRKRREYIDEHSEALDLCRTEMIPDSYLWKSQWRPGSNWTNDPKLNGREMAMGPTNTGNILNQIQLGNTKHTSGVNNGFTLWHSGFTTRIKTPTGRQLAELDALVASERNVFARRTAGALFGANRCFLESGILDLFVECVDNTNVVDWTPENIRPLIDERDIQLIALALQAAKYPTNYPAVEPCTESDIDCRNVREVSFTPMNALVVDDAYFKPHEIEFLYSRSTKRTIKEIQDFQAAASWNQKRTVQITDNTEFVLKHPKAVDVQNAGFIWAGSISSAVAKVLSDDSPTRNRVNLMSTLVDRESLRSFLPYIDKLIVNGTEKTATDEELHEIFAHLSDDPEIVRRLELDIRDFEDRDIVAYMATPRYMCKACEARLEVKDPQRLKDYQEHPILIPQDAVSRFFTFRRLS